MLPRSCVHCCTQIRVENMHMLQPGQHITFPGERGLKHIDKKGTQKKWYKHHAIVQEVKKQSNFSADLDLIHFWSTEGDKKCGVTETTDSYHLSTDEIYIRKYKQQRYRPAEIVRRARTKLSNESKYNIVTYNCEHLATWCVVGELESMQVNFCMGFARQFVIATILCALVILKIINMEKICNIVCLSLLLYSIYYLSYRHLYFIKKYDRWKTICKYCLDLHLLDLWARFGFTYLIAMLQKLYFPFAENVTSLFIALVFYLIIGNIIKFMREKHINYFPDLKQEIKKICDIKKGDVIFLSYEGSCYYIVVTYVISDKGKPKKQTRGKIGGIFYDNPFFFRPGMVKEHCFELDLTRHKVMSIQYTQFQTYISEQVVARGRTRIGEKKWNWFSNRSHHFCHWAKVKEEKYKKLRTSREEAIASSATNVRSSLLIERVEVRIRDEILKGDIVEIRSCGPFTDTGIVLDIENCCQDQLLTMSVVLKKGFLTPIVEMTQIKVDLRVDRIWIHRYHPVHCYSRENYMKRAYSEIGRVCGHWTQTRFIRSCIIKPLNLQRTGIEIDNSNL